MPKIGRKRQLLEARCRKKELAAYSEAPSAPKSAKSVFDLGKSTSL